MPKIPGMLHDPCVPIVHTGISISLPFSYPAAAFLGLAWTFPCGGHKFWGTQLPHSSILGCCSRLSFYEGSKSCPQTWHFPKSSLARGEGQERALLNSQILHLLESRSLLVPYPCPLPAHPTVPFPTFVDFRLLASLSSLFTSLETSLKQHFWG